MPRYLFSYNQHSRGSRDLARAMGIRRIKVPAEQSTFRGAADRIVYNWGSSEIPEYVSMNGTRIINPAPFVKQMTSKRVTFDVLDGSCRIPNYSSQIETAQRWLADGSMVLARTVLNGHSGAGIVVMDPQHPDTWNTPAPLYVKYIKKRHEFRVHIANKQAPNIFLVQRKGLRREFQGQEDVNTLIRNLANGYVFVRNEEEPVPQDVLDQAVHAFRASRLDFGAIDVIWNERRGEAYVLEINTAPGLVGTTVTDYANALRNL